MPLSALAARRLAAQKQPPSQDITIKNSQATTQNGSDGKPTDLTAPEGFEPAMPTRKRKRPTKKIAPSTDEFAPELPTQSTQALSGHTENDTVLQRATSPICREPEITATVTLLEADSLEETSEVDHSMLTDDDTISSNLEDSHEEEAEQARVQFSTFARSNATWTEHDGVPAAHAILKPGMTLVAVGSYDLVVQKGSVSVLGAIMHAGKKVHRVYAPSSHSLPVITALQHIKVSRATPAEVVVRHCSNGLSNMSRLNPAFGRLWSGSRRSFEILESNMDDVLRRRLKIMTESDDWQSLPKMINDDADMENSPPRLAVCGPKGSGKSSMTRYLSNALLSGTACNEIMLLDIDPGQPEFSICGDVALHRITYFNLGPPFTHPCPSTEPYKAIRIHHYGFVTPRDDPEHYEACVKDLFSVYHKDFSDRPLIVNFSGWILGQGAVTMQKILNMIKPTAVVYMSIEGPADTLDVLRQISADSNCKIYTVRSTEPAHASRSPASLRAMQSSSYFHFLKDSKGSNGPSWIDRPITESTPRTLPWTGNGRVSGVLHYIDQVSPDLLDVLVEGAILAVVGVRGDDSFENSYDVRDHGVDGTQTEAPTLWKDDRAQRRIINQETVMEATSGSSNLTRIVRRSRQGVPHFGSKDAAYQPLDPHTSQCFGHVFVSKIDVESRVLHVSTPMPDEAFDELRKPGTTCVLVRGRTDQPNWALMEQYYYNQADSRTSYMDLVEYDAVAGASSGTGDEASQTEWSLKEWIARTPRAHLIDKSDVDMRRRFRPWKLRRNLE